MSDLLAYVAQLERERDSYRNSYRYWKGRLNDGTYIDGAETHTMCFDRVEHERNKYRAALEQIAQSIPADDPNAMIALADEVLYGYRRPNRRPAAN